MSKNCLIKNKSNATHRRENCNALLIKLKRKLKNLKSKKKNVQTEMANPDIASNFDKLGPLQEKLSNIQKQLDDANNAWEKAIEEMDNFE